MTFFLFLVGTVLGGGIAFAYFVFYRRKQQALHVIQEEQAKQILFAAEKKVEEVVQEVQLRNRGDVIRIEKEIEEKYAEQRRELLEQQRRMDKKEELLERKFDQIDQREREQEKRRTRLEKELEDLKQQKDLYREKLEEIDLQLEKVARLTEAEAKAKVMASIADAARQESARLIKEMEEEVYATANKKAQEILTQAIQRFAGEVVGEHTVSVVAIPSEEMKGRIIGREGRNIRALEAATGCDLIIDDTPEAVVISGFDPVRRQIAKRTLEELVLDGRIHPARIESVARKARKNIDQEIREAGEQALFDLGLNGIDINIVKLLGQLKFRTSFTQNVLAHSIEVAFFCGMMAEELGLDVMLARRCGLLHDIGKGMDHEVQGSHAVIGGTFAKKFKESPIVVNAIWSHHFDIEPISVFGPLTNAADALSAARPGARRENVQTYIKRLEDLERIAMDFQGVEKSYAIQAGRELRVIVAFDRLNDEGAMMMARDIANRVENELTYPGQIKVTVIREMRVTEIAQ
ncbi:MAG: ribonuclease Y [Magnetococcus sp. DMHC-6]